MYLWVGLSVSVSLSFNPHHTKCANPSNSKSIDWGNKQKISTQRRLTAHIGLHWYVIYMVVLIGTHTYEYVVGWQNITRILLVYELNIYIFEYLINMFIFLALILCHRWHGIPLISWLSMIYFYGKCPSFCTIWYDHYKHLLIMLL